MDWYLTQFEILKSEPIIAQVVAKLDLTRHYWYAPTAWDNLRAKLGGHAPEPIPTHLGELMALVAGNP